MSPKANIRHLAGRKQASNDTSFTPPSEETFRAQQEECAETLKSLTIWKRVLATTRRPIYSRDENPDVPENTEQMKARAKEMLDNMQASAASSIADLDRVCTEATSDVDEKWRLAKMDIVPGAALLDKVYKKYGLRFEKIRDGVAVAAQMESGEIDSEIKDFINGL